jgi:hypothetical protein
LCRVKVGDGSRNMRHGLGVENIVASRHRKGKHDHKSLGSGSRVCKVKVVNIKYQAEP